MLPGKASGAAASPTDLELQPILTGQGSPRRDSSKAARARQILRDPVTRAALGNLALILTWQVATLQSTSLVTDWQLKFLYLSKTAFRYFFSTLLSLWNRKLVGEGHGVFGKGAFPGESCNNCWNDFVTSRIMQHIKCHTNFSHFGVHQYVVYNS